MSLLKFVVVILLAASAVAVKSIKEQDLQVITLKAGQMTTARRTSPIPQLRCKSGCAFAPQTVQCYNKGWDGQAVNWECKGSLPEGISFGELDVSCEGFDYPDDPYITVGSCGLTYTLEGTAEGSKQYYASKSSYTTASEKGSSVYNLLFWIVVGVFVIWFIWGPSPSVQDMPGAPPPPGYPGGGYDSGYGGGYGGGSGGPPGGPGFRHDNYPGSGCGGQAPPPNNNGPGFWSGAFTGGVLGYLFNRNGNQYGYGGNYDGAYRRRDYGGYGSSGYGSSGGSYGGSGSGSSGGGGSRMASGFATTSRR